MESDKKRAITEEMQQANIGKKKKKKKQKKKKKLYKGAQPLS